MKKCRKKNVLKTTEVKFTSGEGRVNCTATYVIPINTWLTWEKQNLIALKVMKEFKGRVTINVSSPYSGIVITARTYTCPKHEDKFIWGVGQKVALAKANVLACRAASKYISLYKRYLMEDIELVDNLKDFCPYFIDKELKYLKSI